MNPLDAYADELEQIALGIDGYRFRDSERYVVDVSEVRRRLRGLVDRMRRAASEKPVERPTMFSSGSVVSDRGHLVRTERRRIRTRR